jgi:hypothetical protein
MERITRKELQGMRASFLAAQREKMLNNIVELVKRSAEQGDLYYKISYQGSGVQNLFPNPYELMTRLHDIFVGVDIEYAEPFIAIRWL